MHLNFCFPISFRYSVTNRENKAHGAEELSKAKVGKSQSNEQHESYWLTTHTGSEVVLKIQLTPSAVCWRFVGIEVVLWSNSKALKIAISWL